MKRNEDIEVLSGQLVAQNMMLQMLIGQATLHGPDRGAPSSSAKLISV